VDERDRPEAVETPDTVAMGGDPRRYYVIIAALLAVIVVLAIRPWDPLGTAGPVTTPGAANAGGTQPPASAPPAIPSPTGVDAQLQVTCGWPSGWRAASVQSWRGRDRPVRSWMAIDPVEATGPLDPAIPYAAIFTDTVSAIGFCAPLGARPPGNARGHVYAVGDGTATPVDPVVIEPSEATSLGELWEPAGSGGSSDGLPAWAPGRYVIEVSSPGGTYRRWLGIEIHDLDELPQASSTPPPASPQPTPLQTD
jgi:hypothetical protein